MQKKYILASLLLFTTFVGLVVAVEFYFSDKGKPVLQRGVSASILQFGTLGNLLSELGFLTTSRPRGYLPIDATILEKGEARISFTLESDIAISGHFYFFGKDENGDLGEFELEKIVHIAAGRKQHAFTVYSLDELFAFRIDIDTLDANITLSDVELINHDNRNIKLKTVKDYRRFQPNEKVTLQSVNDNGLTFSTLKTGDGDGYLLFNVDSSIAQFDGYAAMFGNKRSNTDFAFNARRLAKSPSDLQESLRRKNIGMPVLSINAPDGEFEDEYGIVTNLNERGREYERLVDISYYDEAGEKVFASPVGIRYHGGFHRAKYDSYKLYFRGDYGSTQTKQSLIFPDQSLPIKSLVLHHTQFPEYSPIGHLLAIDAFEAIGVDTPRRQPVLVYLNNQELGFYYLTDHLSKRNFEAYFGTEDFRFYRFKSYNTEEDRHALSRDMWLIQDFKKGSDDEFPEEHIYERFDVEGITNFMVANTVFNLQDYCQGVLYRRDDLGDKKWRMIGWDFDGAFMKVGEWTVPKVEDSYNVVEESYTQSRDCPYQIIFRRLLANSPEYRQYFKEKLHNSLETVFSPAEMKHRLSVYRKKYEGKFGVTSESFEMLENYFEKRPAFIKEQTDRHLAFWDE